MISEFQDLSDKIDRLAQLAQSLRSENYLLRQANALLSAENVDFNAHLTKPVNFGALIAFMAGRPQGLA